MAHLVVSPRAANMEGCLAPALNLCLIDDNYRQNPPRHREMAQQALNMASSKIRAPPRRLHMSECYTPGRPSTHTHALFPLVGAGGMKDRCLCAGSSWQLVAGLLMSLGGSSDGIQSGFIAEQEGRRRRSVPLLHTLREILHLSPQS